MARDLSVIAMVDSEKKEMLAVKIYTGSFPNSFCVTDFITKFSMEIGLAILGKEFLLEKVTK